jgi:hypothetical protein
LSQFKLTPDTSGRGIPKNNLFLKICPSLETEDKAANKVFCFKLNKSYCFLFTKFNQQINFLLKIIF